VLFVGLVPLGGEKEFKPRPQNRILVPLWSSFQDFRRAPPSFLYGSLPTPNPLVLRIKNLRVQFHVLLVAT